MMESLASKEVEYGSRGIYGVGNRYQAMATEDTTDKTRLSTGHSELNGLQESSKYNYQSKPLVCSLTHDI